MSLTVRKARLIGYGLGYTAAHDKAKGRDPHVHFTVLKMRMRELRDNGQGHLAAVMSEAALRGKKAGHADALGWARNHNPEDDPLFNALGVSHRTSQDPGKRVEETERKAALHLRTLTGKTLQRILDEHSGNSSKAKGIRKMVRAELRRRGPANDPARHKLRKNLVGMSHREIAVAAEYTPAFRRFHARGGNPDYWNFKSNKAYSPRALGLKFRGYESWRGPLTAAQRKRLMSWQFAIPSRRKLPLINKAHVRNAAARLAQMKKLGTVTTREYRAAKARILAAEKQFKIGPYRTKAKKASRSKPTRKTRRASPAKEYYVMARKLRSDGSGVDVPGYINGRGDFVEGLRPHHRTWAEAMRAGGIRKTPSTAKNWYWNS